MAKGVAVAASAPAAALALTTAAALTSSAGDPVIAADPGANIDLVSMAAAPDRVMATRQGIAEGEPAGVTPTSSGPAAGGAASSSTPVGADGQHGIGDGAVDAEGITVPAGSLALSSKAVEDGLDSVVAAPKAVVDQTVKPLLTGVDNR